jgi:hypothetical protein
MKHMNTPWVPLTALGLICAGLAAPAHAQVNITPAGPGRIYIELKDATLADSLELIFKAAGNPSHIIDESAQKITIGSFSLTNVQWDSAVRSLANQNNFKVYKNESGAYVVEPRVPVAPAPGADVPPTGPVQPTNPFMPRIPRTFNTPQFELVPQPEVIASAQTRPSVGGRAGGGADPNAGKDYHYIIVRHLYAGGIAQLFGNATVVPTDQFVSPAASGGGGSGRSGSRGGNRGGGGGTRMSSVGSGSGGGVGSFGGNRSGGLGTTSSGGGFGGFGF